MTTTIEALAKEYLSYDADTGLISAKLPRRKVKAGSALGGLDGDGYLGIHFFKKKFQAHRLAWLLHHGSWPKNLIDHIDGDTTNNRMSNLRDVSTQQNMQNSKVARETKSGLKGVFERSPDKFFAHIRVDGKIKHLGTFPTKTQAFDAYVIAASTMHSINRVNQ